MWKFLSLSLRVAISAKVQDPAAFQANADARAAGPVSAQTVIAGSAGGRGPESMNTGLWNMDSGLAAARRPGMTTAYQALELIH